MAVSTELTVQRLELDTEAVFFHVCAFVQQTLQLSTMSWRLSINENDRPSEPFPSWNRDLCYTFRSLRFQ